MIFYSKWVPVSQNLSSVKEGGQGLILNNSNKHSIGWIRAEAMESIQQYRMHTFPYFIHITRKNLVYSAYKILTHLEAEWHINNTIWLSVIHARKCFVKDLAQCFRDKGSEFLHTIPYAL